MYKISLIWLANLNFEHSARFFYKIRCWFVIKSSGGIWDSSSVDAIPVLEPTKTQLQVHIAKKYLGVRKKVECEAII